ncbi:MAG: 2-amino-4-hydroxy-6-hydroxymethyldihydropteridine diphosphokinase, partial [Gammaproteobacteria bacterium]|nr:2-amino-4-hydroxy-6-hydroxymethyldihydropteridine diphosphokinase [Gammaproteobacteria bacterium]
MNDRIFLEALEIQGVIGIYEWERNTRQTIRIDLEMPANAAAASGSDEIEDTLNYKDVAKRIINYVEDSSYMLVETLAENIAQIVMNEFGVAWIDLSVSKPGAVRGSKNVGIRIHRGVYESSDTDDVFLSLGSNIEPHKHLHEALQLLTERFGPLCRSTVYRNKAMGFVGEDFLNLVVSFPSREKLDVVKAACTRIEDQCGRTRGTEKFAPRTIDIDLLLFGDTIMTTPQTTLPRPEILRFPFMLRPLAEL